MPWKEKYNHKLFGYWCLFFLPLLADPPSAPLGLTQTESTDNSLSISWNRPVSDGGRSDLFYRVLYSDPDPDKVGVMIEANCTQSFNRCVTEHECTITDLQPATKYVVRVSAHNGVSDQNEGGALARLTQVTLETDIARKLALAPHVKSFCPKYVVKGDNYAI